MTKKVLPIFVAILLALTIVGLPVTARAQQAPAQAGDGEFVLGSIILSILHFPYKLATCVGTQASAAVFYTVTYDVPGNYDGGTNGRDIGEVARRSCTGAWFITPSQVKSDYGS